MKTTGIHQSILEGLPIVREALEVTGSGEGWGKNLTGNHLGMKLTGQLITREIFIWMIQRWRRSENAWNQGFDLIRQQTTVKSWKFPKITNIFMCLSLLSLYFMVFPLFSGSWSVFSGDFSDFGGKIGVFGAGGGGLAD